ncbi:MAG: NAD(P)/FAD-dependent oxidoreductase [Candidatus Aenigmatarchaeota archaeon]
MYDVIIVGAGIAGSVLADRLGDLNVLVIEKNRNTKVDSGIVAAKHIGRTIPKGLVDDKIDKMSLVSPGGRIIDIHTQKPFAFLVNRGKLESYFRKLVKKNIVYDCVKEIIWEDGFVQVVGENDRYYGKIVVGCDGACSSIRKAMQPGEKRAMIYGVIGHHRIEQENIHIYFNKLFSKDFFSWTIPQNNEFGLMTAADPLGYCNSFKRKMGYDSDVFITPMTIGMRKSYGDMALLVGESAGQVKPITGGGIDMAISCSVHAAGVIKKAVRSNNTGGDFLQSYEMLWKGEFGKEIEKQMWLRKIYSKLNNQQIDELFNIAKTVKIGEIDDYIGLSGLMKHVPRIRLFFWALRNVGVFR